MLEHYALGATIVALGFMIRRHLRLRDVIDKTIAEMREIRKVLDFETEMTEIEALAIPVVTELEESTNSGEWKFHQAYARLKKETQYEGWQIGLAIHQAIARIRKG